VILTIPSAVLVVCLLTGHNLAPAVVSALATGATDVIMKALPGPGKWASPSGAISGRTAPPAWSVAASRLLLACWIGVVGYCFWWATQ